MRLRDTNGQKPIMTYPLSPLMIAIAVVWFYLGWQAGFIFFYPPILALIGLVAILKGLLEGNLAGRRRPRDSARGFVPSEDAEVD